MKVLDNGIAVMDKDTHISTWVRETMELCHDRVVRNYIVPLLYPGDWVVDGGAAIGDHTIAYAEAVGPLGKVLAFEPNPEAFECLEWNMRDHPQVVCQMVALSDKNKRVGLVENENAGAAFLSGEGKVRCTSLDSIELERLNYVKLDIEGHEFFALQGMRETLARFRPFIIMEINRGALARNNHTPRDILSFLEMAGYRYYNLVDQAGPVPLEFEQFDLLCRPK